MNAEETAAPKPHVMMIEGKKYFAYEIRVPGGSVSGWDERPMDAVRKAWAAAWKAHAVAVYALSAKSTKANIKNIRATKVEEASFGSHDEPEGTPVPQWSPGPDEMLVLNGIEALDGRGSASILSTKILGIAYKDDRKKT